MSLTFDNIKNALHIADICKNNKTIGQVNYINEDDVEGQALTKIRLNNKDEAFFPKITEWTESNKQLDRIYICGTSGCGKSRWIRAYIQRFKIRYPKSKVLLFSSKLEDEMLDDLPIERVKIDDEIHINPFTLEEIVAKSRPILAVFDDIEDFKTKKINAEVARLRDEIMRNGRSYGIYSVFVHHDPCSYRDTKHMLFECTKIVMFPKQCGRGTFNYLMESKLRLSKKIINMLNTLNSNYVCVNKGVPPYIISDKYIILDK